MAVAQAPPETSPDALRTVWARIDHTEAEDSAHMDTAAPSEEIPVAFAGTTDTLARQIEDPHIGRIEAETARTVAEAAATPAAALTEAASPSYVQVPAGDLELLPRFGHHYCSRYFHLRFSIQEC